MNYCGNDLEAAGLLPAPGGVCYLGDPDEQRELLFDFGSLCTDTPQSLAPAATVGLMILSGYSRTSDDERKRQLVSRGNRDFSTTTSSRPHARTVRCSLARRSRATCFTSSPRYVGLHPTQRCQNLKRARSRRLCSRKFRIDRFHEGALFRRRQRPRSHISRRCKVR